MFVIDLFSAPHRQQHSTLSTTIVDFNITGTQARNDCLWCVCAFIDMGQLLHVDNPFPSVQQIS